MAALRLSPADERMLSGQEGHARRLSMRIIVALAEATDADELIDVTSAHVDGCLYHGEASLDFADRMASAGAKVSIPTTLNVSSLDLLHPGRYRGDPEIAARARRLMDRYVEMGCRPTWTCAPYQLPDRPTFGEHVAWAESNAIVFVNSVLGARTDRYGAFIDLCAAVTGRVPLAGLHLTENRRGQVLFRIDDISPRLLSEDVLYPVLGHFVGAEAGVRVPVLDGLPASVTEDQLKALGAAAASSGGVALFHAIGVTPEAPTIADAFQGADAVQVVDVTAEKLATARDSLSTSPGPELSAVSLGTPHFSVSEFAKLVPLVADGPFHRDVDVYVSTGRDTLAEVEARGWLELLERAGVRVIVDTCTYITPILEPRHRVVMTNSAKWAYYAPGNVGVKVVFGSTEECIRSAYEGSVWRDPDLWAEMGSSR
jgi:predicted aconitase